MNRPRLTPTQAKAAIAARIAGEWDEPALVAFGPLSTDTAEDVRQIAQCAFPAIPIPCYRYVRHTGSFVPTVNGIDLPITTCDEARALQLACETALR